MEQILRDAKRRRKNDPLYVPFRSVCNGDVAPVRAFFETADPDSIAELRRRPVATNAVERGNLSMLRLLIENGADLEKSCASGSPLSIAVSRFDRDSLHELPVGGANPDGEVCPGTPLATAVDPTWKMRETEDCEAQALTMAEELLRHGADPNVADGSVFLLAIVCASADMIALLLRHGADIPHRTATGATPLYTALERPDVFRLLERHGAKRSDLTTPKGRRPPMYVAAGSGDASLVADLIADGFDLHAPFRKGWTPLHVAASRRHAAVVRTLLDHGADPSRTDSESRTPLDRVGKGGRKAVRELLEAAVKQS